MRDRGDLDGTIGVIGMGGIRIGHAEMRRNPSSASIAAEERYVAVALRCTWPYSGGEADTGGLVPRCPQLTWRRARRP